MLKRKKDLPYTEEDIKKLMHKKDLDMLNLIYCMTEALYLA